MGKLLIQDKLIFVIYFIIVASYGFYIYRKKKKAVSATHDFFLAEGSLTWWAIGASLIASNISAEQFIGMSGNGFSMGLGISTYEWMAAATLVIVAVFWLALYILVNLTSILYLGALAVSGISGLDFQFCMIALAVFAIIITIGGMKVIGYTDVIQVFFLVIGGLATTYLAISLVSDHF